MNYPGKQMIGKYGLRNTVKIKCLYLRNRFLMKLYKFDEWHLTPLIQKEYAMDIINELNTYLHNNRNSTVVECGCGLGDVIGGGVQ